MFSYAPDAHSKVPGADVQDTRLHLAKTGQNRKQPQTSVAYQYRHNVIRDAIQILSSPEKDPQATMNEKTQQNRVPV